MVARDRTRGQVPTSRMLAVAWATAADHALPHGRPWMKPRLVRLMAPQASVVAHHSPRGDATGGAPCGPSTTAPAQPGYPANCGHHRSNACAVSPARSSTTTISPRIRHASASEAAIQRAGNGEPGLPGHWRSLAMRGALTVIATGSLAGKVSASAASSRASIASAVSSTSELMYSVSLVIVMYGHPSCRAQGATSRSDRAFMPVLLDFPGPARQIRVRSNPGLDALDQGARVTRATAMDYGWPHDSPDMGLHRDRFNFGRYPFPLHYPRGHCQVGGLCPERSSWAKLG